MNYHRLIEALHRPAPELGGLEKFAALHPDFQVHLYETLPSTNQTAWQLIAQGCGAGTVVIAQEQTAGRGQWGRTWVSPPGGLYFSLVLEPDVTLCCGTLLTLATAWGVVASLANLGISLQIKWPNDLVSNGDKVGGILTESKMLTVSEDTPVARSQPVVVGVGLNWENPLPANATSIRRLLPDQPVSKVKTLEDLAAIALRGTLQGVYYWQQHGDAAFLDAYRQKLADVGKKVIVEGHPAIVEGVSQQGDLVVSMQRGSEKIARTLKPGEIRLGYNV